MNSIGDDLIAYIDDEDLPHDGGDLLSNVGGKGVDVHFVFNGEVTEGDPGEGALVLEGGYGGGNVGDGGVIDLFDDATDLVGTNRYGALVDLNDFQLVQVELGGHVEECLELGANLLAHSADDLI